jgi:hypothetical protein
MRRREWFSEGVGLTFGGGCVLCSEGPDGEDYYEFGFADVNLHEILANGDLHNVEVDMHGANSNEIVATMKLTFIAQQALRSILEDEAP